MRKKKKKYARQIIHTRDISDKVTLAIDFTDDSVVQCECDVPVVKNTFENDRK